MKRNSSCTFGMLLASMLVIGAAGAAPPFALHNNLGYEKDALGKDVAAEMGMARVNLLGVTDFPGFVWAEGTIPDEQTFKTALRRKTEHPGPVVLDFEKMSLADKAWGETNLANWLMLLQWSRQLLPNKQIGIYWFPGQVGTAYAYTFDYQANYQLPTVSTDQAKVRARSIELARHVDFMAPSLYASNDGMSPNKWCRMARNWINDARYLNKPAGLQKPVYPYIWPEYLVYGWVTIHNPPNDPYKEKRVIGTRYAPSEFWAMQLEALRDFGGYGGILWSRHAQAGNVATETHWRTLTEAFVTDRDLDLFNDLPAGPTACNAQSTEPLGPPVL